MSDSDILLQMLMESYVREAEAKQNFIQVMQRNTELAKELEELKENSK